MTFNPQDWKSLRKPILGLGFVLVIIGLLAYYADNYHQQQQQALQNQQNALNQAKAKYLASGQEKETIIKFLPLYNRLIDEGMIGEEPRIEWIEALRQIHQNNKLFGIEYNIGEQQRVKPSFLNYADQLLLQQSTMRLSLSLLHEGDVLTLLNGLQSRFDNFIVKSCEINRQTKDTLDVTNINENMNASCEIDWYTLRDSSLRIAQ